MTESTDFTVEANTIYVSSIDPTMIGTTHEYAMKVRLLEYPDIGYFGQVGYFTVNYHQAKVYSQPHNSDFQFLTYFIDNGRI